MVSDDDINGVNDVVDNVDVEDVAVDVDIGVDDDDVVIIAVVGKSIHMCQFIIYVNTCTIVIAKGI